MLSRCLNPGCEARFRYLHEGRLFKVDASSHIDGELEPHENVEYYWLCGVCSQTLRVAVKGGRVITEPLPKSKKPLEFPEKTTTKSANG